MRKLYNTTDNFYLDEDVMLAFKHAFYLGKSESNVNINKAFEEWRTEYSMNTLKPLTLDAITDVVSLVTKVSRDNILVSHKRYAGFVIARHLISWFGYTYTKESEVDMALFLGYVNHTSIVHGVKTISNGIKYDRQVRSYVESVKSLIISYGYALDRQERLRSFYVEYEEVKA